MKLAAVVAVVSLSLPSTAFAAPRAGRLPPRAQGHAPRAQDPLELQVARALFPRARWERLVATASLELTQQLVQASQGRFRLHPDFADRLRVEYERMAPYEELVSTQAHILDRQYTPAELRQLLAFYRTPVGKKSVLLIQDLTAYCDRQMQQKVHAGISDALGKLRTLVYPAEDDDRASADPEPEGPSVTLADPEAREL
jgi:hypothetical protein